MSEEEPNLSACMQNLKIMPRPKPAKTYRDEELPLKLNPFARKHKQTKSQSELHLFGPSCSCKKRRISRNTTAFKRPTNRNKILREPIIVYIDECSHIPSKKIDCKMLKQKEICSAKTLRLVSKNSKLFGENMTQQDFKSIIAGCEQLSLSGSGGSSNLPCYSSLNFRECRLSQQQRPERANTNTNTNNNNNNNVNSSSCSQQAMARLCLNPPPCDVTIDELASYFETFVHIPKKMSSMAEMMYI